MTALDLSTYKIIFALLCSMKLVSHADPAIPHICFSMRASLTMADVVFWLQYITMGSPLAEWNHSLGQEAYCLIHWIRRNDAYMWQTDHIGFFLGGRKGAEGGREGWKAEQ